MRGLVECLARVGVLVTLYGGVVPAQQIGTKVIADEVECPRCRIEMRLLRILDVVEDTSDGFPTTVRLDKQGRFWILRRGDVPVVFDTLGKLVSSVGRQGSGPGEYRFVTDIIAVSPETTIVLDGTTRRATYLNSALQAIRAVGMPLTLRGPIIVSWPDRVIGSGITTARDAAGQPLHLMRFKPPQASISGSFGVVRGASQPQIGRLTNHALTQPSSGTFWAGWMYGYTLVQFRLDGQAVRVIERRPAWFARPHSGDFGTPTRPPPALLVDLQLDASGRLWTFLRVPSEAWRSAWLDLPPGTMEVASSAIAVEKLYDTIVEVIDPNSAKVYARSRFSGYFINALPGLRGATYTVNDDTGEGRISSHCRALAR